MSTDEARVARPEPRQRRRPRGWQWLVSVKRCRPPDQECNERCQADSNTEQRANRMLSTHRLLHYSDSFFPASVLSPLREPEESARPGEYFPVMAYVDRCC
jgi:hypothetical protein